MSKLSIALLSTAALAVLSLSTACASGDLKKGDSVPSPVGYRNWHHVKSMVIQPGHALHEAFGGIHHVYANDAAMAGLKTGVYDDGAVFAFDLLEAKEGGNAVQEGARKVLGVMHRSSEAFAATGGWGFAGFADGGKDVVKDMGAQCYQCHASQEPRGYVFSQWRP